MKKLIEKFKNLVPDRNKKIAIYFIFYFVFFFILFIYIIASNVNQKEDCPKVQNQNIVDTKYNYGFRYEINMNGNEVVLSGSRYDNKLRIDKRVEGLLTKYYTYYSDTYIFNENNEWVKYDGKIVDGFDVKLINLDYLDELIANGKEQSSTTKEKVYYNEDKNITIEKFYTTKGDIDYINVIAGATSVILSYYDQGKIENFDVATQD